MSCKKGNEFMLNEKVSKEFLNEMNALDSLELKYFSDSSYVLKNKSDDESLEIKDSKRLSEISSLGMKNISGISVSEEAMPFYTAVLKYLDEAKSQGDLSQKFFKESDPQMRRGYFEKIQEKFKKLRNKPDSILTIQKDYFNKVSIK